MLTNTLQNPLRWLISSQCRQYSGQQSMGGLTTEQGGTIHAKNSCMQPRLQTFYILKSHSLFVPSGSGPSRVLWVLLSSFTLKPSSLTLDILSPPLSIFTLTRHQHRSPYPSSIASR